MKRKPDLKPGDEFWYYDSANGTKKNSIFSYWMKSDLDIAISISGSGIHYRAIQGIRRNERKPKVKAREFWINEAEIKEKGLNAGGSWKNWFESPYGEFFRTTPPANPEGWMHVVEQIGEKKCK